MKKSNIPQKNLKNWFKALVAPHMPIPKEVHPMLAKLCNKPFDRENWLFEIKWDGYRMIAYVTPPNATLISRNQKNYSEKFPSVITALKKIGLKTVLDGELVMLDKFGIPHFQWLQNSQNYDARGLVFYVFDVLWLEGKDLSQLPLIKRKEILAKIIPPELQQVQISEYIEKSGISTFALAKKKHLEGIIAKEALSTYSAGQRSPHWLKIKTKQSQEAIIVGYTEPTHKKRTIGALLLGMYKKNQLTYIGRVGTGFTEAQLSLIKKQLHPYIQTSSPFSTTPKINAQVTWVAPQIVCEVTFLEWTTEQRIRHAVFKGIRDDKRAKAVFKEKAKEPPSKGKPQSAKNFPKEKVNVEINHHALILTNLRKVFWPTEGILKGDVIEYYRKIAPFILPYLKGRPESLNRHPNGITGDSFFQKNQEKLPSWIATKKIYSDSDEQTINYLLCQNEATLVYIANLGCIEINPWLSKASSLNKPDFCVFDLDPEKIAFSAVLETAQAIHVLLDEIGASNYCKTSGATGLHIYVPLGHKYDFQQARQFVELICRIINAKLPKSTSMVRSPQKRQRKVYLDFLQNRRGQTIAAPYSLRPRPGAPVSTPLLWTEVNDMLNPTDFTIDTIPARLEKIGDLWKPVLQKGIHLETCLNKLKIYL
jgi:bifunctional non-homologous end joining protein LigD